MQELPILTSLECYNYVQQNINKLSNNNNQNIPKYSFVTFFNAAQVRWFEARIKYRETHSTVIDELQQFLVNKSLSVLNKGDYLEAEIPKDYAHYSRIESKAKECENDIIDSVFVKESDLNKLLLDEFWKPSFTWRENLATVRNNKLNIYSDVPLSSVNLVYYRWPKSINLEDGYTDLEGKATTNVNPEINGASLYEVLALTLRDLSAAIGDSNKTQFQSAINQIHT